MTLRTSKVARTAMAVAFAGAAAVSLTGASHAQTPGQGWFKVCTKQEDNDVCVVQNIVSASTGQLLTAVGLILVEGKVNNRILQVSVPSARNIQPGINMQIDGGKSQRLPYAVCMPDKCVAQVPLTDAIVQSLQARRRSCFHVRELSARAEPDQGYPVGLYQCVRWRAGCPIGTAGASASAAGRNAAKSAGCAQEAGRSPAEG